MTTSIRAAIALLGSLACFGCHAASTPATRGAGWSSADPQSAEPRLASAVTPRPASTRPYAKPSEAVLAQRLTRIQFEVTQHEATEPPFRNAFWDNHEAGIYVDVATGEPLFSSLDKFNSGTGWPSFTRPIEDGRVVATSDDTLGMTRVEVRSKAGSSHLGHVFDDGPAPTHQRYCINSASLRFIPLARLAAEGYLEYAARFAGDSTEAPAATNNACAMPAPGDKPGCEATLETLTLEGPAASAKSLRDADGVLDVQQAGKDGEIHVTYDPARIAKADLVDRWVRLGGRATR